MLSQTAEYALRAVLYLARQAPGAAVPAEAVAAALGAPANYLGKTLHALARAGLVEGFRGRYGGFRLAVAPAELTVARVIEAIDEPRTGAMCLLGGVRCDRKRPCAAHVRWTAVQQAVRAPLLETTVAELLAGPAAGAAAGAYGAEDAA